jgi:hypothetical protein
MPPGTAFAHAMDQAVQTTRHVVLVLSPAYLRSAMTEAEWRPGFVADPSGTERRLLPVRVEVCQAKGLLSGRRRRTTPQRGAGGLELVALRRRAAGDDRHGRSILPADPHRPRREGWLTNGTQRP